MKSALDSLIEELEAGTWQARRPSQSSQVGRARWPPPSVDAERRFFQPHAKLFPFIGRKVRTPAGTGTLIQVFAGRVTVLLESHVDKCAFFKPTDIEPVSWEP
jgi:hypothetical protein